MGLDFRNIRDRAIMFKYFNQGSGPNGPVQLTIAYTATQFVFKWKAPAGSFLTFHNGNGTTSTVEGGDDALKTHTTDYSGADTFNFWITGDVTDLTWIDINLQPFVSGSFDRWNEITGLVTIACRATGMIGDIENLISLPLISLNLKDSSVDGNGATLSVVSGLTNFQVQGSGVTWDTSPAWSITGTIRMQNNSWTFTQVDNCIKSMSTCTGSTIDVAGTNAHRTAGSNADLNTLYANGNTITLNDVLSAEMISDGVFSTDGADLNVSNCLNGNYTTFGGSPTPTSFEATSNGGGMHMAGTADEISFVSGQKYIVAFDEVLNSGTAPYVDIVGSIGGGSVSVEGLQLSSVGSNVFEFTSNVTTTGNLLFMNAVTETDFEITNISVKDAGWDDSDASWNIAAGVAAYDDANDDAGILQTDGNMASSIATEKVYRAVFKTDATPTTAAMAIKNAAEDVVYLAQDDYTDDTHTRYFTTPADVSGAGIAFVAYQSGDAFDLDDVSLKEVTFP